MSRGAGQTALAVIGAGAWGTTLAWLAARQGQAVRLWARRAAVAAAMAEHHENQLYLPGVALPENLEVTSELAVALAGVGRVVVAVPSHGLRSVAQQMRPHLQPGALVVIATKGLEQPSGLRMSQVLSEVWGRDTGRLVTLSGPNLSAEITAGMPAVSVAAAADAEAAEETQKLLSNNHFRIYTNSDIIGVELGGSLKNVIALGAGISDGLGYGSNARAALITRGQAEICRLGLQLGAQAATFSGIAGMGDLIATCHSPHSRNWTVGYRLGQGERPSSIISGMHNVAEGIFTAAAVRTMARGAGVETPICEVVYRVLNEGLSPETGVQHLMTRRWRGEAE